MGLEYREDPEGRARQLGFPGVQFGDWRAMYDALVNWINDNGGAAGRQVVPVYHVMPSGDRSVAAQQTCAAWIEDDEVFAAVPFGIREILLECLSRRDVVIVNDIEPPDDQAYRSYPGHFFTPGNLSLTQAARLAVEGLDAQNFFQGASGIGLLRLDIPEHRRAAEEGTHPALARLGLEVDEEFAFTSFDNSAQISSAVLQLKTAGVNRVLFVDERGNLAIFFPIHAEGQGYRPRYGLTTHSVPGVTQDLVPPEQLAGAMGVGWAPGIDVGAAQEPPHGAARELCSRIYDEAGVDHASRLAEAESILLCSELLMVKTALDHAEAPTASAFRAVVEGDLGQHFSSPVSFRTAFGPQKHTGAAGWRPMSFTEGCGCWEYVGDIRPVPTP